jgi:SWI/SNF related-matrix-associated actin-dependent regulator of chromatin subfamily C
VWPHLCILCPDCFSNGIFPSNLSSFDFARVEGPASDSTMEKVEWKDEEVIALLQGIELHNDNWRRISDYVGSRTVEECIVKFGMCFYLTYSWYSNRRGTWKHSITRSR